MCIPPTIVWELGGTVVQRIGTHEAYYTVSSGTLGLYFPHYGRNVTLSFANIAAVAPGKVLDCAQSAQVGITLYTADNGYAALGALPLEWKNLFFSNCGKQSSGDVVTSRAITLTQVSAAHVAGSYEIVVQGAGLRAGTTLRVSGTFDVFPQAM